MRKKMFLFIACILCLRQTYGQWNPTTNGTGIYYSLGNVGINTSTPSTLFDVAGALSVGSGTVNNDNTKMFIRNQYIGANPGRTWALSSGLDKQNEANFGIYDWTDADPNTPLPFFDITPIGYIGIGTVTPSTYLSVSHSTTSLNYGTYPSIEVNNPNTNGNASATFTLRSGNITASGLAGAIGSLQASSNNNASQLMWLRTYSASYPIYIGYNQNDLMVSNGNVGINTTDTKGYTFAVNGDAVFNKVVVKQYPWADYVFDKKYPLISLESLENYIYVNKHLPSIPSADEVNKNGIDVGENQKLFLQKIEELTLYLIEENKKIEGQSEIIQHQSLLLEKQSMSMNALESVVEKQGAEIELLGKKISLSE